MTRINAGIPPEDLTLKHLLAEHREIKRIPNNIVKGKFNMNNQPEKFVLGEGHVKFFYNKLKYLKKRYELLYAECVKRKFAVKYYGLSWKDVPEELMNDWEPSEKDITIVKERIQERLSTKK